MENYKNETCNPPSDSKTCPHCGRALKRMHITLPGGWFPGIYEPCDCANARRNRELEKRAWEQEAKQNAMRRHKVRMNGTGIPKRFRGLDLDVSAYVQAIREGHSLIMVGGVGTGKTSTACATAEALADEMLIRFTTLDRINGSMFDKSTSENDLFSSLAYCGLLVLDDLDKGKVSEWSVALLYRIINTRYEACKPIIVTMNCQMSDLAQRLTVGNDSTTAEAIMSRLYEMAEGRTERFKGADKRLLKRPASN